jgi:ATP-dependent DNA helicase DinG
MPEFIQEVKDIFAEDGLLSSLKGYEYRKPQQEMAMLIAESLENSSHLIAEAPTGVGKSFAYLVPSIIFALREKRKAIISTCTINLQEQLIKKDIPAIQRLLPYEFKPEILKGRHNYICTRRLNNALIKKNNLFVDSEEEQLQEIYNWVQRGGSGSLQDITFKVDENVWSQIFAEEGICSSKSCGTETSNCFYQQAKVRLKNADLVILNHYLFFTLFGLYENKSDGFIFANDFAIFDEAHRIEQIAAENISPSVSREQVRFWLHKLYNPKSNRGFLTTKNAETSIRFVRHLLNENDAFFENIDNYVSAHQQRERAKGITRIREPLAVNNILDPMLLELYDDLRKLKSQAKNDDEENEINNYARRFSAIKNTINDFLTQKIDEHVYWIDFSGRSRRNISLTISPIDMAEFFRKNVWGEDKLAIMTSATLSINKSLRYFQKSLGAENTGTAIMDSTFDYQKQMKVYVSRSVPSPNINKNDSVSELQYGYDYEKTLTENIKKYALKTEGGALILFTNIKTLRKILEEIRIELAENGIDVYAQGEGLSKTKLLSDFKKNHNSVLLGVDSFWMGVDVPGSSLRNVIITKLPFDVPDHPIIEAKIESIEKRGGNPFTEFSLPGAILKFKQGIGRLIRNKTDKGIIVILDSRVATRPYGKYFLNSLPECEIIVED